MVSSREFKNRSWAVPKENNQKRIANVFIEHEALYQIILARVHGDNEKRDKAFLSVWAITGARISEILALRKEDVTNHPVYILFHLPTRKNKQTKERIVPCSKELYTHFIVLLNDYLATITKPEDKLFSFKRKMAWYLIKHYMGKEYYPHWGRHFNASKDSSYGAGAAQLMQKYGWAKIDSASPYIHLNYLDTLRFQEETAKKLKLKSEPATPPQEEITF